MKKTSKPPVLLVLTTTKSGIRSESEAIREALDRKAPLCALFVLDPALATPASQKLLSAVMGPAAARPLGKELLKDYENRARVRFEEIKADCEEIGVEFESRVCRGPFVDEVRSYVQSREPSVVILPKRPKSFLSRIFMRDELAIIKSTAPHTLIRIIEEEI
ncbi:MAG: hypothetical protein A3G34_03010 [Candidatus Lindowbacteria bacterium RIFCSPLOWO2_12_FULL_62_27]|nr:MAG: hypothetical protein A3G34_03010 [Candidatus Lindowbacteria bacterium RIFCSPLOWO2_12_FULL_62_27]OGH61993.1 MAG: hypothetical protein A3I06_14345 [Candidatus Lindowbacteria bacterium RIFCSPLOWO2_02_FULL_62_12]